MKDRKLKHTFGTLQEEGKLVRVPKGFDANYPQAKLLKLKSYIVWIEIPVQKDPDVLEKTLRDAFRDAWSLITQLR